MTFQPDESSRHPLDRPVHPLDQPPPPPPPTVAAPPPQTTRRVQMPGSLPVLTFIIIGINVAVFLADMALGTLGASSQGVGPLTLAGAKNNLAILGGEYWRFITPMFLHGGIVHLGLNSYFLYLVGRPIERSFGTPRFLAIYLLSGIAGAFASFAFSRFNSIGASGALFGLIGAWIPLLYRNRAILAGVRQQINRIVQVIAINLLIGLLPGIDNWAHLGGLLGGFILGWLATPLYALRVTGADELRLEDSTSSALVWLAIALFAIVLGGLAALVVALRGGVAL